MKTLIIFTSVHHQNAFELTKVMAEELNTELVSSMNVQSGKEKPLADLRTNRFYEPFSGLSISFTQGFMSITGVMSRASSPRTRSTPS
jgi:hypothetical protein